VLPSVPLLVDVSAPLLVALEPALVAVELVVPVEVPVVPTEPPAAAFEVSPALPEPEEHALAAISSATH